MITGGYSLPGQVRLVTWGLWDGAIGRNEKALAGPMTAGPVSDGSITDDWHRFRMLK